MSAKAMIWMWVCSDSQFCSIKSILFVLWSMQKTKHWHPACDKGVLPCHFLSVVNCTLLRDVLPHSCCTWHVPLWVGLRANLFFSFFASSALIFLFYDLQNNSFYEYLIEIRQMERKKETKKKESEKQEGREGGRQGWGKERKTEISNFLYSPAGCFSFMSLDRLAESVLHLACCADMAGTHWASSP